MKGYLHGVSPGEETHQPIQIPQPEQPHVEQHTQHPQEHRQQETQLEVPDHQVQLVPNQGTRHAVKVLGSGGVSLQGVGHDVSQGAEGHHPHYTHPQHSRVRLHTAEKLIDVDGLVDDFEVLHDSHQRIQTQQDTELHQKILGDHLRVVGAVELEGLGAEVGISLDHEYAGCQENQVEIYVYGEGRVSYSSQCPSRQEYKPGDPRLEVRLGLVRAGFQDSLGDDLSHDQIQNKPNREVVCPAALDHHQGYRILEDSEQSRNNQTFDLQYRSSLLLVLLSPSPPPSQLPHQMTQNYRQLGHKDGDDEHQLGPVNVGAQMPEPVEDDKEEALIEELLPCVREQDSMQS